MCTSASAAYFRKMIGKSEQLDGARIVYVLVYAACRTYRRAVSSIRAQQMRCAALLLRFCAISSNVCTNSRKNFFRLIKWPALHVRNVWLVHALFTQHHTLTYI